MKKQATLSVELADGKIQAVAADDSVVKLIEDAKKIRDAGEVKIGSKMAAVRAGMVLSSWHRGPAMRFLCGNKVK